MNIFNMKYLIAGLITCCLTSCAVEYGVYPHSIRYSPEILPQAHYFPNPARYRHYSNDNYYNRYNDYRCDRRLPIRSRRHDIFVFGY
jgi:hypothetical protein